jgi:hypothetical protein
VKDLVGVSQHGLPGGTFHDEGAETRGRLCHRILDAT